MASNKIQRISTVVLAVLVALLLASCGAQTATQPTTAPAAPTAGAATAPAAPTQAATATESLPAGAGTAEATGASTAEATSATTAGTTATPAITSTAEVSATAGASQSATPAIVAAANAFLATLSDAEKKTVSFAWSDTAQKQRWSNLPQGLYQRAGLMWGDMSEAQQNAWLKVMQATLSAEGYNRVLAEWNADDALAAAQGSGGGGGPGGQLLFGKKYYWVAIIGTPSETSAWQWQWGGHHVTVNATIVGANIALTPSFIGVQPATYTDANGNTVRPLGDIEDEAFALVNTLDATQQQAAILGATPIDLVLGPGQDGKTIQTEGLPAAQLTAAQQAALLTLIGHYAGLVNDAAAAARMAEIKAGLAQTAFAWYGPTTAGSAAYFRISGPSLVIEYAPQGGGGTGTGLGGAASNQHIHGIYRDPTNDYGAKNTQ